MPDGARLNAEMRVPLVSANFRPAVGGIDRFTEGCWRPGSRARARRHGALLPEGRRPLHEAADGPD